MKEKLSPLAGGPGNIRGSSGNFTNDRSTWAPSGTPAWIRCSLSRSAQSRAIRSSSIVIVRLPRFGTWLLSQTDGNPDAYNRGLGEIDDVHGVERIRLRALRRSSAHRNSESVREAIDRYVAAGRVLARDAVSEAIWDSESRSRGSKKGFVTLTAYVTSRNGWVTSIPGAIDVTIECLPGSTLPDLPKLGYDVWRSVRRGICIPRS
jgi:hypothetical protein